MSIVLFVLCEIRFRCNTDHGTRSTLCLYEGNWEEQDILRLSRLLLLALTTEGELLRFAEKLNNTISCTSPSTIPKDSPFNHIHRKVKHCRQ